MKLSIDKFGGYLGYTSKDRTNPGLPGVGFKLTSANNYDIENKRLTNVGESIDSSDAATVNYVKSNCLILEEKVNFKKRKLINVADDESDTSVVTKSI